jgi:hypothetical protein
MWFLLLALALANPTPEESVPLPEGIFLLPPGSLLTLKEGGSWKTYRANKSWLLPESHYERALIAAKQLEVCKPALAQMTESALEWQKKTYEEAQRCLDQYGADRVLAEDLEKKIFALEARALAAEGKLATARRNSAVAWAIAGGLVLGASSALVITLGN